MSDSELPLIEDYRSLFLNDTPLLDVRAAIEFQQGAFPHTQNAPLLNDTERHEIGICYKQQGNDAAVKLGHQLVQGEIKAQRVAAWQQFAEKYPHGALYCFRGGMRSKLSQQWLYEQSGIAYPRIKGGYKAMRRFLLQELETSIAELDMLVLSGRTGSGKTLLLQHFAAKVDLEGIFHHRGSVFGIHVTPQPPQIEIENTLSIQMMKLRHAGHGSILLEDEGGNIGSRRLPQSLIDKMRAAPILLLEVDVDKRVDITWQEYIIDALAEYQQFYGEEQGWQQWSNYLLTAVDKIRRRLGDLRYRNLKTLLQDALASHMQQGAEVHKHWIHTLLTEYYDPMYDFQIEKKQQRIVFRGNHDDLCDYLEQHYAITRQQK